jgi:hypothetical protein
VRKKTTNNEEDRMGFLEDYKKTYRELTGEKLRWRTGFGFAYRMRGFKAGDIRRILAKDDLLKYRDPKAYVKCIRMCCRYLHDPTLRMLKEMGIGDFDELVKYEGKPAEFDTGTESWHELNYPEGDIGEYGEEAIERIHESTALRLPLGPIGLSDDDDEEEEEERPEGSWDELWQEIYRCHKEEEDEELEGLPSTFGELFWKMHWY